MIARLSDDALSLFSGWRLGVDCSGREAFQSTVMREDHEAKGGKIADGH
jgi:hypothetical protein